MEVLPASYLPIGLAAADRERSFQPIGPAVEAAARSFPLIGLAGVVEAHNCPSIGPAAEDRERNGGRNVRNAAMAEAGGSIIR